MHTTGNSSRTYSDMAGLTQGPRGGVAKKLQRKSQDMNGVGGDDFKFSDIDDSGKRTVRSINSGIISGKSGDVMYLTGQRGGGEWMDGAGGGGGVAGSSSGGGGYSRPMAIDVFSRQQPYHHHNRQNLFKSRSEPDLLDSGNASYYEDEDEENSPGIFNRPGFGKTVFLPSNRDFANTLHSFDHNQQNGDGPLTNGDVTITNGDSESGHDFDSLDIPKSAAWRGGAGGRELPWDQDEVGSPQDNFFALRLK
jgi:hypothetical protein